mgnify:CR=1 FL=1
MDPNLLTIGEEVARLEFPAVSATDMAIVSAIMDDPNPIHFDPRAIEDTNHTGLVNPGSINLSYLTQAALSVAAGPTDIVSLDVRFEANVYEGEDVTAIATVERIDDNAETLDLSLVLEKGDETTAATGTATVRPDTECTE